MEDIIDRNFQTIVNRWTEAARSSASARGLTQPELRNVMPVYLSSLVHRDERDPAGRPLELVESHFSSRLRQGFDLSEIQNEFGLLGRCILQAWADAAPEERPLAADLERVLGAVQAASGVLTDMYARHAFEDAQAEKRYFRLIRQAFTDPQEAPDAARLTLSDRLRSAMLVVTEAMGADGASILIYDPGTRELVLTTSAGLADEVLARYARTLAPASLAGLIASREEPTEVLDAATTELDVPDSLRRSGIHAVIGVRLPPQRKLLGVMYVGMREQRRFSARERRRMEAIAEVLALLIENAQLYEALEQQIDALHAEQRMRDILISVIAHDLRGPLSAARMAAQMMSRPAEQGAGSAEVQRKAALIVRNLDRTEGMVRDLLDTQRLHAGEQLPLAREQCDLAAIARDVAEELAEQHGHRFELGAPPEPVEGCWGADELRRALWNLASNAVKYGSAEAPVRITVRRQGDGAEVAVHNEGPAIPPDEQARLFEPFARARSEQSRSQGWGLGLAVVRAVAEAHGGTVDVDSAPDRGTTFTLRVPLA